MKNLKIFTNSQFGELGVLVIDGKEMFPATECARILGYTNPHEAIRTHCKGVSEFLTPSAGGGQKKRFIPEGDLYRLIIRSKLPSAEKFERWVFDDVIPAIRKVGLYATPEAAEKLLNDPDFLISALQELKAIRLKNATLTETINVQKQQIAELKPKAGYYDVILACKDAVAITTIAKDYGKSGQWLNEYLHSLGIQFKQGNIWLLYQKHAPNGYTCTRTHNYTGNNGEQHSKVHTYWTQKGRLYIYEQLKHRGVLPLIEQLEEFLNE